jgi:hypothetical protein
MEISFVDEFLAPVWISACKRVYPGEEKHTLVSPGVSQSFGFTQRHGHIGKCGVSVDIAQHSLSLAAGSE